MTDKTSLFELAKLPQPFGVTLLVLSLILLLSPYLSGADFGIFKIPSFTDRAKRNLKILGPIAFITMVLLFVPLISIHPAQEPNSTTNSNSGKGGSGDATGDIASIDSEQLSNKLFEQRRSLAQQLDFAENITIPTEKANASGKEKAAIEKVKAKKDEKMNAIKLKLESIWKAVEDQDKFFWAIYEMQQDDMYADILNKRQKEVGELTGDEFLLLIDGLTAEINSNTELSKELFSILQSINK